MNDPAGTPETSTRGERLKEELWKYALISAYLWICFAVLTLFKAAILESESIVWAPLGFAIVQALVLGKFLLIGDALKVGRRDEHHPLAKRIAWRSLALLGILVVFKALEEIIVGLVHGKGVGALLEEAAAQPLWVHLAPVGVMLLIMIPMITAAEIHRILGAERFRASLLGR